MGGMRRMAVLAAVGVGLAGVMVAGPASAAPGDSWLTARGSDRRTGEATNETAITKGAISKLAPRWSAPGQSVEGTEAIVKGTAVYVVTSDAKLRRLKAGSGATVWTAGLPGVADTPTVDGSTVYVLGGSRVKALDAATGASKFNTAVTYFCGDGSGCFGGLGAENGKVVVGAGGLLHILNGVSGVVISTTDVGQGDFDSNGGGTPAIDAADAAWYAHKFIETVPIPPSKADPLSSAKITGNGGGDAADRRWPGLRAQQEPGHHAFDVVSGAKADFAPGAIGQHKAMATDGTRLFDVMIEGGVKTLTAYDLSTGAAVVEPHRRGHGARGGQRHGDRGRELRRPGRLRRGQRHAPEAVGRHGAGRGSDRGGRSGLRGLRADAGAARLDAAGDDAHRVAGSRLPSRPPGRHTRRRDLHRSDPRTSLGAPGFRRACPRPPGCREVVSVLGPVQRGPPAMKLTGAQALIKALEMEGVEVMFGLPGGCILPAYDPLLDSSIRHILVRHEQGAGHMAEGYAHVTGRPGVAMVTSGPAATNMVTPLCDAYMDSIPHGRHHRPGARRRPSAPTPSRSATPSASPGRSPSTTSW